MRIIRWSVDHPVAVLAVYSALILASVLAMLFWIPVRLTPALDSVQISVTTEAPGLTAEQVERRVTTPIERSVAAVGSVRYLRSMSMHGMSVVTLEFPYHHDMRRAEVEVLAAVPESARVQRLDPLDIPVLRLAVRDAGRGPGELQELLDTVVTARLRQVDGVASVYTFGGPDRTAEVRYRTPQPEEVRRRVEAALAEPPQRFLEDPDEATAVLRQRPVDLQNLVVAERDGRPVRFPEVATLETHDGGARPARYRCNGRAALELNVVQTRDGSSPRTLAGVQAALGKLQQEFPGLEFETAYDNARFVQIVQGNVWMELALAVFLTGLVIHLFLGDWRGTLVAMATVPASLAGAVLLFVPLELAFDSSTLIGLLLAIGRLVDDTIIDLDAVARHRAMDKDPRAAAIDGCSEVRRAVIAATVLICLAMLPLTFAGGLTQDMFVGIVWPFLLALAASLAVSLTLTPMLAARLSPRATRRTILETRYKGLLKKALRHRGTVLAGAFAACWLAWTALPFVGSEMMPLSDTGQLYCVLEARPGASTDQTSRLAARLEAILQRQPEVQRISTEVGAPHGANATGYGGRTDNSAVLLVTLSDKDERTRTIWEIADGVWEEAMRTIPHLRRLTLKEMGSDVMATAMAPIELILHGPDLARLDWLAEQTRQIADRLEGLEQPATSWSLRQPAWEVSEVADLQDLPPDAVPTVAPDVIEHDGLRRSASVMASYRNGGPGSMQLSMDLLMASRMQLPYPAGYDLEQRGDMVQMMDSFERILVGLGVALGLMYLALAVQFGSLTTPLVILAAIPLELPGVVLALLLADQTFSTVSLLGLVILSGMDVTASVLLVDAALQKKDVVEAAASRLKPVLMTVCVTLAVMAPLAFFPRTGMDAYAPLATVVVGGLTMSTLLTLGIIPILIHRRTSQ